MNALTKDENIIFFEDKLLEKHEEESDKQIVSMFVEMVSDRAKRNALKNVDEIAKDRITELEDECMKQEFKLQNCIPGGIIFRIVLYASALVTCMCIFTTQIVANYKIADYHVLIVLCIAFAGLLHTAVSTLKDWKEFIARR